MGASAACLAVMNSSITSATRPRKSAETGSSSGESLTFATLPSPVSTVVRRQGQPSGGPYSVRHVQRTDGPRAARIRAAVVLVRVLPAEGRRGRDPVVGRDQAARAPAPDVRV